MSMTYCLQKYSSLLRIGLHQKLLKSVNAKMTSPFQRRLSDIKSVLPPWMALHTTSKTNEVTNKAEIRELMSLWPEVVRALTNVGLNSDKTDALEWFEKVLLYNVPKGKMLRGLFTISSYKELAPADQLTEENIHLVQILGWCTEIFQAFLLLEDDIMDRSRTRRGQPCWYIRNDLGNEAINDGLFLQEAVFQLLNKYFRKSPCYLDLVHTFHKNTFMSIIGQSLDLKSKNFGKKPNFNIFTIDRYNAIVKYKTGYYTCLLPVTLAMHFAGIKESKTFKDVETVLLEIGSLFQVQDDYLDCYGIPEVIGKIGTDIQEGKCSWLVVVALQRATPGQRKILEECYGNNDPEKVARVKQLYNDLDIKSAYATYEKENFNLINSKIKQISSLPHSLFFNIVNALYCRNI